MSLTFSTFKGQTEGQTVALIDTGTSLAVAPQAYVDFIYGSIPGALKQNFSGFSGYQVPCSVEVELSFVLGGVELPINPIDATMAAPDGQGGIICQSSFAFTPAADGIADFILGDSFLRNAYVLFDYGMPDNATNNTTNVPFVQILPVRCSVLYGSVKKCGYLTTFLCRLLTSLRLLPSSKASRKRVMHQSMATLQPQHRPVMTLPTVLLSFLERSVAPLPPL